MYVCCQCWNNTKCVWAGPTCRAICSQSLRQSCVLLGEEKLPPTQHMAGQADTHSRARVRGGGMCHRTTPPPPFCSLSQETPSLLRIYKKKRKKNNKEKGGGGGRKKWKNHSLLIAYIITTIGWEGGLLTIDSWAPVASQEEREKMATSLFICLYVQQEALLNVGGDHRSG